MKSLLTIASRSRLLEAHMKVTGKDEYFAGSKRFICINEYGILSDRDIMKEFSKKINILEALSMSTEKEKILVSDEKIELFTCEGRKKVCVLTKGILLTMSGDAFSRNLVFIEDETVIKHILKHDLGGKLTAYLTKQFDVDMQAEK